MILAVSRRIQAANKRTKGLGEEKDSSKKIKDKHGKKRRVKKRNEIRNVKRDKK